MNAWAKFRSTEMRIVLLAAGIGLMLTTISCGGGSPATPVEPPPAPPPQVPLTQLSRDTFSNPESQHATEVEPSMFAFGSTLVTAFQVGRIYGGGSSDIGFATSTDASASWTNGLLPALTRFQGGSYNAASDPSVVFDAAHSVWIIASLAIASGTDVVVVSRSSDAKSWASPITVSSTTDADKEWITCDNNSSSAYYGHCYLEWDDPSSPANGLIWMSTSTDGGMTWGAAANTSDMVAGVGGVPTVGASGIVIVPIQNANGTQMLAFTSTDGGATWNASVAISSITDHTVAGSLRTTALPATAVDASGRIFVVWQDCRFRSSCSSNDIVMSTSSDGSNWTAPVGIPIDAVSSTVDHFIPSIAADSSTSGGSTRLTLTYYFYPTANCIASACQLEIGVISSSDGGNSWGAPTTLAAPISLPWLPNTVSGVMVGDYIATSYANGQAYGVFAVAQANQGSTFNEAIFTTTGALPFIKESAHIAMRADSAISRRSDHPPRKFYDLDHEHPIPRRKSLRR
jgi:hypothetical protein